MPATSVLLPETKTANVSAIPSSDIPALSTSGIKRKRDSIPKPSHEKDTEFVAVKDRITTVVKSFDDIKNIAPADIVYIFKLREAAEQLGHWEIGTDNLAKLLEFCILEPIPNLVPLNEANIPAVNDRLLTRLLRIILVTNEGSGRTGKDNYEGLARFAWFVLV